VGYQTGSEGEANAQAPAQFDFDKMRQKNTLERQKMHEIDYFLDSLRK
jgi:hypothetical protein